MTKSPNTDNALANTELKALRQQQDDLLSRMRTFVECKALTLEIYEVEKQLFRMALEIGKALLTEAITRHGTGKIDEKVIDVTGQWLPYQDDKKATYLSIFGIVEIWRAYYWRKGHKGFCPLDQCINLPARRYSYLLDEWVQNAVTEEPFDKAVERFEKILGFPVSKLGQEQVAREAGVHFDDFYKQKCAFAEKTEGTHIGIEADGKGVRMIASEKPQPDKVAEKPVRRGKGEKSGGLRKMATATADFTFTPQPRTPEEMVSILMRESASSPRAIVEEEKQRQAKNTIVAASMAGKQVAIDGLIERVCKRDPDKKKKIVVLLDGDPALENVMVDSLRRAQIHGQVDAVVLDIMHAMEYLWDAGTALLGEKSPERVPWVRDRALNILKGNVGYVIGGLRITLKKNNLTAARITTIKKTITYFDNHKHMMKYDQYLLAGYPIATGIIEGTCGSLIKDRADRSGSRWSSAGAQAILNERAVMKNGDWDSFWKYHMEMEKQRLYGNFTWYKAA